MCSLQDIVDSGLIVHMMPLSHFGISCLPEGLVPFKGPVTGGLKPTALITVRPTLTLTLTTQIAAACYGPTSVGWASSLSFDLVLAIFLIFVMTLLFSGNITATLFYCLSLAPFFQLLSQDSTSTQSPIGLVLRPTATFFHLEIIASQPY